MIIGADVEVEEAIFVVVCRAHGHEIVGSGDQGLEFKPAVALIGSQDDAAGNRHGEILISVVVQI